MTGFCGNMLDFSEKYNIIRIKHSWKSCVRDERTQGSNP